MSDRGRLMHIAFYATLKSPDHPVPSGDRRMARGIIAALEMAGHRVELCSHARSWARTPEDQEAIRHACEAEVDTIIADFKTRADKPDLWFTYHLYYRAPDWIGPRVAAALSVPYVVAEASFAMKRAVGPWAPGHDATETALVQADVVFALKTEDVGGLKKVKGLRADIFSLPPFLDVEANDGQMGEVHEKPAIESPPMLLAVGMMRARAKLDSYRFIARSLETISDQPWCLVIVGDGPARPEVEAEFKNFAAGRVQFVGAKQAGELADYFGDADLFIWPGIDEAYGMVYLEAQAAGLPVVATDNSGAGNVVVDGVSGRLVATDEPQIYGKAIAELLADPERRGELGEQARRFVINERSVASAAKILGDALGPLVGN